MKTMIISEFKAKCIGTLKDVQKSREPVLITLRGRPIAEIAPVGKVSVGRRLGAQRGAVRIAGDIVNFSFEDEWEVGGAR
jgi:antitoxin (DNA-binding transcriptional repressor) of toxin-antitoxin stability system